MSGLIAILALSIASVIGATLAFGVFRDRTHVAARFEFAVAVPRQHSQASTTRSAVIQHSESQPMVVG